LRGRRLEGPVLHNVVMKKVDFSGVQLQGAWFVGSDLQRADFGCIDEMPGFTGLLMLAGLLARGEFETPRRECADLRRIWIVGSELQGSSFRGANLRGSFFDSSDLQGALLDYAYIRGAYLNSVTLHGASLANARLQAATLIDVGLRGASLDGTLLQGASLQRAVLQGASLNQAVLDGAQLKEAFVWRADPRSAKSLASVRVTAVKTGPVDPEHECGQNRDCKWTAIRFGSLKQRITEYTPGGDWRSKALDRIEMALDPAKPLDGDADMAKAWADLEHSRPELDAYENILRETGCNENAAPYVIQGLILQGGTKTYNIDQFNWTGPFGDRFGVDRSHPAALARYFLDEANCPGARGLSEEDRSNLRKIRDGAWPERLNPVEGK
jgi:uncharacterized protein YjbI with pentapeptide repeats